MIPLVLRHITTGWVLAFSKVRLKTKEHALGYGWEILTPVVYAVCFVVVKQSLVGKTSIEMHNRGKSYGQIGRASCRERV